MLSSMNDDLLMIEDNNMSKWVSYWLSMLVRSERPLRGLRLKVKMPEGSPAKSWVPRLLIINLKDLKICQQQNTTTVMVGSISHV